jgi:Domain of unknown function (DUF4123)
MSPPMKEVSALKSNALKSLSTSSAPLFAVLDSARTERILHFLRNSREEYQSLYEGPEAQKLSRVAPYLLSLPEGSPALGQLVEQGWGESWGIYLSCRLPLKELRRHLRRFLLGESEETRESLYFRFYDPRVLRVFLPTCTTQQWSGFFGEAECFWMESREGEVIKFLRSMKHT